MRFVCTKFKFFVVFIGESALRCCERTVRSCVLLLNTGSCPFQRKDRVARAEIYPEGFGMTVTEALWKEVSVVGGNVGGIPL